MMLANTHSESFEPSDTTQVSPGGAERVAQALIDVQAPIGRVAAALARAHARDETANGPPTIPSHEKD